MRNWGRTLTQRNKTKARRWGQKYLVIKQHYEALAARQLYAMFERWEEVHTWTVPDYKYDLHPIGS